MDYLGHQVSLAGLEAHPKDLESLVNMPFPQTLRSMQSFLGSLNYYSRFIEELAVYASVLYELRESDFHEIRRGGEVQASTLNVKIERDLDPKVTSDRDRTSEIGNMADHDLVTGDDHDPDERNRWEKSMISFTC